MTTRDNGLQAQHWAPLADVESALTDHVLTALATEGIAAYAETSSNPEAVYLGAGRSTGPSDKVSVDRERRSDARVVLSRLLPELRAEIAAERSAERRDDEAARWEEIVAGFEADGPALAEGGASRSDAASAANTDDAPTDEWADVRPAPPVELAPVDDEEHFIPPPAPPVPKADAVTRAAWIGIIGGPLYLIIAALLGWRVEGLPGLIAIGAFVGGFVTLVARMKDRPTLDDRGDDGAIV